MLSMKHTELQRQNFPLPTTTKTSKVNGNLDNYWGFGSRQKGPEEKNTTTSPLLQYREIFLRNLEKLELQKVKKSAQ